MNSLFNKILGRVEFVLARHKLNIFKTIWINFRSLPLRQAIKFPIVVYGGLKIMSLRGKIIINAPIKCGMIKFGDEGYSHMQTPKISVIWNISQMIFNGSAVFSSGFRLRTTERGTITFGKECFTNVNVSIDALDDIYIGDYTRISFGTTILNGDLHYIIDMNNMKIGRNHAPIRIGAYNWITSDVKVMKGCVTPDWVIVLGNSLINKDYTKTIPENSIIGGQPAKLIAEGMRRIFSEKSEIRITDYFKSSDEKIFNILNGIDLNEFCINNIK